MKTTAIAAVGVALAVSAWCCSCTDLGGLTSGDAATPVADAATDAPSTPPDSAAPPPGDSGADTGSSIDAKYRRTLTVTAGAVPVLAGYTVCFAANDVLGVGLLASGKVRPDYADLRLFGPNGEQPRVLEPLAAGRTSLCFRLAAGIVAGGADNTYELRYGDPAATPPPNAMASVFDVHDDFDGTALDTRWLVTGVPTVAGGLLTLPKNGSPGITMAAASDGIDASASLEMRVKVVDPTSAPDSVNTFYYWFGFQRAGDFVAAEPWTIFVARGASTVQAEVKTTGGGACNAGCAELPHSQTTGFRVYRIDRTTSGSFFLYDDGTAFDQAGSNGDLAIMLRNWLVTSDVVVDWVRARPIVAQEPTAALGAEQPVP